MNDPQKLYVSILSAFLFYFFLYKSYKHLHISYVRRHSVNRGMNDTGKKFWLRHILWDITCCMPIWSLTCATPLYYCSFILPVQSLYSGVFCGVNSPVLPPPPTWFNFLRLTRTCARLALYSLIFFWNPLTFANSLFLGFVWLKC